MSRPLLQQARNVVRLRDVRFDASVKAFEAAVSLLRKAEDELSHAVAEAEAADASHLRARQALSEHPGEAPARLALIGAAEAHCTVCVEAREAAARDHAEAERRLDAARGAMLAARARLRAMSDRAQSLSAGVARQDEEAAAVESEERAALRTGEQG